MERDRDEKNRKLYALQPLLASRHSPFADDRTRTLNMADVLFHDDIPVRDARRELMKSLSKTEGMKPDGTPSKELGNEWNERQWDLVSAMAAVLKTPMTKDDFSSGYSPKALNDMMIQQMLATEVSKPLIIFARKNLGLRWNPAVLFQYAPGTGIIGTYQGPPPPTPPGPLQPPQSDEHT